MPEPTFIYHTEYLNWPGYPGSCIQAQFCVADFCDNDFLRCSIPFTEMLSAAGKRRRAEYLAGRYVARLLLQKTGYAGFVLHRNRDRTPLWPADICGTISHAGDTVLCALHRSFSPDGVGIDVEYLMTSRRTALVQNAILTSQESAVLACLPLERRVTLAFSAKESLFKAIYPRLLRPFDFHASEILSIEASSRLLVMRLRSHLSAEFPKGRCFTAQYRHESDKIITLVYYP